MGSFAIEGSKFVYRDRDEEETLIDFEDYFSNKGRVPFHTFMDDVTIPSLIIDNMDKHDEYCDGDAVKSSFSAYYTMLDVLFIREHIKTKYPKKVIEVGAPDTVITDHIMNILFELHPETEYHKVDESEIMDYQSGYKDYFDIAIINGTCEDESWKEKLELVEKAVKSTARVLCLSVDQPLLEQLVSSMSGFIKEYCLSGNAKLFDIDFRRD